jgi:hypothetical protein
MAAKADFSLADLDARVSEDWVVVCAVRCEPVSIGNSLLTGKLTGNFAILRVLKANLAHETAVPQRLLEQFPAQIIREIFLKIREFFSRNRELPHDAKP